MQRRGGGAAVFSGFEGDLRVYRFQEELLLAFREDLNLRLVGELREHLSAIPREREDNARHELVGPGVTVEDLGIERDLLVRGERREFGERRRGIEQVHP